MKNNIIISIVIIGILIVTIIVMRGNKQMDDIELEGGSHTTYLEGYKENIENSEIIYFSYDTSEYYVEAKLETNILHIKSNGGNIYDRDGTRFILSYDSDNLDFLKNLYTLITKYQLNKNNGYTHHVNGLPAGLGSVLDIKFIDGERIYKSDNQSPVMNDDAEKAIYKLFHEEAKRNNYDFTTIGSNQVIYDDANEEYLQGVWTGQHFGNKIKVVIRNQNIQIYVNDVLMDDTEYSIFEGNVRTNKLKEGLKEAKDYHDFEEFNSLSLLTKKNDFTMTAYFMKDAYST